MAAKMKLPAITPFSVKHGMAAMEQILLRKMPQVTVCDANFTLLVSGCIAMTNYANEIIETEEESESQKADTKINNFNFWTEFDGCKTQMEKQQQITLLILRFLTYSLKLEDDDVGTGNFKQLGMDSLMTIEMLNFLQRTLKERAKISHTQLRGTTSVQLLANRIVGLIPNN
jgi:acyl carrier protein